MKKSYIAGIIVVIILLIIVGMILSGKKYTPTGQYLDKTFQGGANAKVTVVEYSDFQCPACASVYKIGSDIVNKYGDKVKFVYKNFPLRSIHPQGQKAAEAAECVKDLGGDYWKYHDILFQNQNLLYPNNLKNYARSIGVDGDKFNACLDSGAMSGVVDSDYQEGIQKNVQATPTFFVGSQRIQGNDKTSVFSTIDEQLAVS